MLTLSGIDIADSRRYLQPEMASPMGKLDVITGHQQVIAISLVLEPQAGDDFAPRQIIFDVHRRVAVTAERSQRLSRLEPWRADPPKDQWSAAHRPDQPNDFGGLPRKALPKLRP